MRLVGRWFLTGVRVCLGVLLFFQDDDTETAGGGVGLVGGGVGLVVGGAAGGGRVGLVDRGGGGMAAVEGRVSGGPTWPSLLMGGT